MFANQRTLVKTFGATIAHYRKKRGLSQRQLARTVAVAPSYLNEIENGQRGVPSDPIVKKLARELKAPIQDIYNAVSRETLQIPPDLVPLIKSRPETLDLLRTVQKHRLPRQRIVSFQRQVEREFVKAIIVAAGRGTRMKHMTQSLPKCLAIQFEGKTLLQTQIETLRKCGISDMVVVRGYQGRKIRYPGIRYVWNHDYASNNILESLMCAKEELEGNVIVSYSDIWYEVGVLEKLLRSDKDIAIGVDIDWKDYYEGRKEHPIEEAENVIFDSDNQVIKIGKIGASGEEVHGEFIGMMKLTNRGCQIFKEHYRRAKQIYQGQKYQRAIVFEKSYLTDILQDMADLGVPIHCEIIGSNWREIDTIEDFEKVSKAFGIKSKNAKGKF